MGGEYTWWGAANTQIRCGHTGTGRHARTAQSAPCKQTASHEGAALQIAWLSGLPRASYLHVMGLCTPIHLLYGFTQWQPAEGRLPKATAKDLG